MNPIKIIRGAETLDSFSEKCGVHKMALYYNECGSYPTVLPSIMDYLITLGYSRQSVSDDYDAYVDISRMNAGEKYGVSTFSLSAPNLGSHPFNQLLDKLEISRSQFAKSFCVTPASLYNLVNGRAMHLSEQLVEAMEASGFMMSVIEELNERCNEYARAR